MASMPNVLDTKPVGPGVLLLKQQVRSPVLRSPPARLLRNAFWQETVKG